MSKNLKNLKNSEDGKAGKTQIFCDLELPEEYLCEKFHKLMEEIKWTGNSVLY